MFSKEDASRLRESLGPMDFLAPVSPGKLIQTYRDFYGLNFGSSRLTIVHHMGYLESADFKVVCQYFQVPLAEQRGTVFLVHGYFDHIGLYSHLIGYCLQSGFSVVAFDLPGHGLSSGVEASIVSFQQYCAVLLECAQTAQRQQVHSPWLLVGQSTGGAVIMDALLSNKLAERFSFDAYVLLAPLLRPRDWLKSKALFMMTRWFVQSTRRTFSRNSHDPEFLKFLQQSDSLQSRVLQRDWVLAMIDFQKRFARSPPSQQAVQIIQGSGDGTVDFDYNLPRILAKFSGSKSYMVSDAGHHLVNEAQPYRDRIFSLLTEIFNKAVN